MGGFYPTNSGWGTPVPMPVPGRDFPSPPVRDPYNPRRTMPQPKYPWRPPGYFPNGWKPRRNVFGKRAIPFNPLTAPIRQVRVNPWVLLPLGGAVAAYLFGGNRLDLAAHGYQMCCSVPKTGPDDASSFTLNTTTTACGGSLANLCGVSSQPYNQAWPVGLPAYDNRQRGLWVIIGTSVGQPPGRARWQEVWHNPRIATGPAVPIPAVPVEPFYFPQLLQWPIYDWDPNWWIPILPVPWSPPQPQPVWVSPPIPDTYPPPRVVGDYPTAIPVPDLDVNPEAGGPVVAPYPRYIPSVDIRPNGVRPTRPHVREPTRPRDRETKYSGKKGFGLLAAIGLRLGSGAYNGMTELMDLVAAIYSSLPNDVIARQPDFPAGTTMAELLEHMLRTIYRHHDQIDLQQAVHNVAMNAIEDGAWGRYFGALDTASRRGPNMNGFDRELSDLRDTFNEVLSAMP